MLRKKIKFLILLILVIVTNYTYSQTNIPQRIDSLMNLFSKNGMFNGNVLVSKNGKVIYNSSFGFTDASKTTKLTPNFKFNIGSITKEFSAVALQQLKQEGKLNLTDKISKFFPELPTWSNQVTIKDILQYTSGLPNVNWRSIKSNEDVFEDLKLVDKLDFVPGTKYDYNMNNVFLRQFVVEKITGLPYKIYVKKYIFKPCKIDSAEITPIVDVNLVAKGFNDKLIEDKPDFLTGGTFITTAELLRFINCLHSKKLINENSLFELGQQFKQDDTQSALGEAKFVNKKLIEHSHDGRAGNYDAILISELNNFDIIILSNNYKGKIFEISRDIKAIIENKNDSLPQKN